MIRYLCGLPISNDDLKMLVRARSLHTPRLGVSEGQMDTVVEVGGEWHDRRKFP